MEFLGGRGVFSSIPDIYSYSTEEGGEVFYTWWFISVDDSRIRSHWLDFDSLK